MASYERVAAGCEHWELAADDSGFPPRLRDLGSKVARLYGIGSPEALVGDCISIIGARRATPYGLTCADMAGRVAAECGVTVVSGGARGCDHAAARGALDAGGATVVVPGCGADVLYPRMSDDVFVDALTQGGCVVSLDPWGSAPHKHSFVRRNAVIAALSQALIVCEACKPSGTFGTATVAAELGRRVYAVPGSIFSPMSSGTNWLLETGASIVCDEDSLAGLISLDYGRLRFEPRADTSSRGTLLDALVASPMDVGEVAALLGLSIPQAFGKLSEYEAAGMVCRLADGRFVPTREVLLRHNG